MNIRNMFQTRTARARGKVQEMKARVTSRGRGALFGSLFSGMRWRVSSIRGKFPR